MKFTPSVPQLQADWARLSDVDRAKTVRAIHDSGISIRQIASQLGCSDSLLRHLLIALDAPVEDRILACQGKISTNELVRRAKAAGRKRAARHRDNVALEHARAARQAADEICDWLAGQGHHGSTGEQIIEEVRREFADRELLGVLPQPPRDKEISRTALIERCRPKRPLDDNATFVSWYHEWLCRWTFFAYPDTDVRDNALEMALQKQWRR